MRNYTDTEADLEYLPNRTAFREYAIPDADAIDDLVDSLWRHGSAQDYPLPEAIPPPRLHDPKPTCRREFVDSRSLYHDINLDDPPVPGYADFPNDIARKLNFGTAAMPSKSPKQARLMAAAAHNPPFAKRAGVPQKVAQEFNQADAKAGSLKAKRPGK